MFFIGFPLLNSRIFQSWFSYSSVEFDFLNRFQTLVAPPLLLLQKKPASEADESPGPPKPATHSSVPESYLLCPCSWLKSNIQTGVLFSWTVDLSRVASRWRLHGIEPLIRVKHATNWLEWNRFPTHLVLWFQCCPNTFLWAVQAFSCAPMMFLHAPNHS